MDAIRWLESLREQGMKLGLENTSELLSRLGNPQNKFPSIHVAGSNGKGTICSILANTFTLNNINTGLFTSPHLCNIEERIRINGIQILESEFVKEIEKLQLICDIEPKILPTFYEATFIIAMMYFASSKIERAIIETGLGGRLDATRLVNADCCILTQISLEHTEILGDTLLKIATEKAAIARKGVPLISIWNDDEKVREIIESSVSSSKLIEWHRNTQNENFRDEAIGLANLALSKMNNSMECMDGAKVTFWPGRMQKVQTQEGSNILLDCAHNPSGLSRAISEISNNHKGVKKIIFGCTKQTDIDAFLQPLISYVKKFRIDEIILTEPQGGRTKAVSTNVLFQKLSKILPDTEITEFPEPFEAIQRGIKRLNKGTLLCIGSLYLIGNILKILNLDSRDSMNIFRK
ncbi:MAG: Dihydrofolate synthase/folylpolyglutamate synthase [Methanobacteriota archaeon]|nr:MAG: Dihydrofolate synthase/folylpolyglutamate synthase [Euryarchaeota archaeon]